MSWGEGEGEIGISPVKSSVAGGLWATPSRAAPAASALARVLTLVLPAGSRVSEILDWVGKLHLQMPFGDLILGTKARRAQAAMGI
eukprot:scaffold132498_cov28-Tisochrysis_lutea.AAC.3